MTSRFEQTVSRGWAVAWRAAKRFSAIDGSQWAAAFAFNAFFSLFPLLILLVSVAAFSFDRPSAAQGIVTYVEGRVPLDAAMRAHIFEAIDGVIESRQSVGLVAAIVLFWAALKCFITLARITNRAWGDAAHGWWEMPARATALLAVTAAAVLVGTTAPALASVAKSWILPARQLGAWVYAVWGVVVPPLLLFTSLSLFYRLATRRTTRFAEVAIPAASATFLLLVIARLFVAYLEHFATLNAVYGVFGGIMALLLWIYLSGGGFIYGACLCAALADDRAARRNSAAQTDVTSMDEDITLTDSDTAVAGPSDPAGSVR